MTKIDFSVWTETPSLAHYRHDWTPKADAALSGIWVTGIGTGANGQEYYGVRGFGDFIQGLTHVVSPVCGFRFLHPGTDDEPSHLFAEYSGIDWMEPFASTSDETGTTITFDSGELVREPDGLRWQDATGRWSWTGRTISDIFVVHVPVQPGIEEEAFYRHELGFGTGQMDGTTVEGYLHQDFAYGPQGRYYSDLSILRDLQGLWMSWVHEFEDGELGGGCFWQGRDGIEGFGPGYMLDGGKTTAFSDITCDMARGANGRLNRIDAQIGQLELTFDLDTIGSPLHVFGRLSSVSDGRRVKRSWCFVEFLDGMVTGKVLDAVGERYRIARGR